MNIRTCVSEFGTVVKMSTMKMMQGFVYECLPTVTIGGNEIRFIGVNEVNKAVHFPRTVAACCGRLLFLGADVMTCTSVLSKNYARVHLRFSKVGLAAKMELDGFKIEGVHNSGFLWFYSIQGLFHVAFELGNLNFQKDCLVLLKDEWLNRYSEPLLEASGVLRFDRHHYVTSEVHDISLITDTDILVTEHESSVEVGQTCADRYVVYIDNTDSKSTNNSEDIYMSIDENVNASTNETSVKERIVPLGDIVEEIPDDLAEEKSGEAVSVEELHQDDESDNYMNDEEETMDSAYKTYFQTTKFMKELALFLKKAKCEYVSSDHVKKVVLVLEYLHYFEQKSSDGSLENSESALFKIMEEFLVHVGNDSVDKNIPIFKNTFNIPTDKYILLYLISDWLGHEYHEFETQIAGKVYTFKQENLMSIDYLPSSETLIDMLFPLFMKTLIVNWCGFKANNELTGQANDEPVVSVGCDHCYSEPQSVSRNTNYPLVQLMLEFGSNSLISGIAHVVFSRLQAQNKSETLS